MDWINLSRRLCCKTRDRIIVSRIEPGHRRNPALNAMHVKAIHVQHCVSIYIIKF